MRMERVSGLGLMMKEMLWASVTALIGSDRKPSSSLTFQTVNRSFSLRERRAVSLARLCTH